MRGKETQGGTNDVLARSGEASTVEISEERCPSCGGRIQIVRDRFGDGRSARHCRSCSRRVRQ